MCPKFVPAIVLRAPVSGLECVKYLSNFVRKISFLKNSDTFDIPVPLTGTLENNRQDKSWTKIGGSGQF